MPRLSAAPQDPHRLRKIATDFWFAVQRMGRKREDLAHGAPLRFEADDRPDDDPDAGGLDTSRVPRRPVPGAGSASAGLAEERQEGV
jgi:hypothetical protein